MQKTKSIVLMDSRAPTGQCYYQVITYTAIRGRWFQTARSGPIPRYVYMTTPKLHALPWGYLDGKLVEDSE